MRDIALSFSFFDIRFILLCGASFIFSFAMYSSVVINWHDISTGPSEYTLMHFSNGSFYNWCSCTRCVIGWSILCPINNIKSQGGSLVVAACLRLITDSRPLTNRFAYLKRLNAGFFVSSNQGTYNLQSTMYWNELNIALCPLFFLVTGLCHIL